jgi:hypothetical protein
MAAQMAHEIRILSPRRETRRLQKRRRCAPARRPTSSTASPGGRKDRDDGRELPELHAAAPDERAGRPGPPVEEAIRIARQRERTGVMIEESIARLRPHVCDVACAVLVNVLVNACEAMHGKADHAVRP